MTATLEICVDTLDGLDAAIKGGADRIELCAALDVGGLSPAPSLLYAAQSAPIPVYCMIRPRAGSFIYTARELDFMCAEITLVRELGFAGVVLGCGDESGLDIAGLSRLCAAADGLGRTLHRVVDLLPDRRDVPRQAASLGFERILTSGGQPHAQQGMADIAAMVRAAPQGVSIMPGSGVSAQNAAGILRDTGAREIHASARGQDARHNGTRLTSLGFCAARTKYTDPSRVAGLKAALGASAQNSG
ncbi:MAG: copper homeostasis protein CutC [Rhodobacteraceae bacterium]|nr:copper homeostasis protein CutC [Paracoccaceae bacterium]